MAAKPIKITFTLDEKDVVYFRRLLRDARKYAQGKEPSEIIAAGRALVGTVRAMERVPRFALEAIDTLESLTAMVEDKEFALPKSVSSQVIAALAYFAQPEDLIPDSIPALGFLDDAIMIKIVEEDFKHDLWGFEKFCKFRQGAEQRPWTSVARERLPRRMEEKRKQIRADIEKRKAKSGFGW